MAVDTILTSARIVHNGGVVSSERYQADGTNALKRGQLCTIAAGKVVPVAAGTYDGSTTSLTAAEYVISLLDVDSGSTDYVDVQKIDEDTVFEGYWTGELTAADTLIGTTASLLIDADGKFAPNLTAGNEIVIVDVQDNYDVYANGEGYEEDADGDRHDRVQFRIAKDNLL